MNKIIQDAISHIEREIGEAEAMAGMMQDYNQESYNAWLCHLAAMLYIRSKLDE